LNYFSDSFCCKTQINKKVKWPFPPQAPNEQAVSALPEKSVTDAAIVLLYVRILV